MSYEINLSASLRVAVHNHLCNDESDFDRFVCDRIREALTPSTLTALFGSHWLILDDGDLWLVVDYGNQQAQILRSHLWSQFHAFCNAVAALTNITQIRFSGTDGTWTASYDSTNRRWIQQYLGV